MKGHVTVPQITAFCPTAQTVTSRHGMARYPAKLKSRQVAIRYVAQRHVTARFPIARHITARHVSSRQYVSPPAALGNSSNNLFYFLNLCYCTLVVKAYSALVRIVAIGTSQNV